MKPRLLFLLGLLAWFTAWWPQPVAAQGTLYPLFTNGPSAKRLNVVVLAEGYTTNQINLFLYDATNTVNNLLAAPPYQEYKAYFNAYAIFVASAEAGSDHPISGGTLKNTYFNSTFDSYGISQLLTIPPNNYNGNYSQGQGKVDALVAALVPEYDLMVMVVNDLEYGGSGSDYGSAIAITSVHLLASAIVTHETGHALGGLADEYESNPPAGHVWVEKPNATAVTSRPSIKWNSWILGSTPIPTPESGENAALVGLFQGAQYVANGWYRPKLDCKMNGLFADFCEVCSEQLVKSLYARLRPIDTFTPTTTNLAVYSTQAVAFSVTTLQPITHNLDIQWFTNNTAVTGATNFAFSLAPKSLGNGSHTLKAIVSDATALVRNDPTGLLRQTNTWNLTVSLNDLALVSARYLNTNRFRFTVTGSAPAGFVIQASTNLLTWTSLSTNSLSGGKYDFTNSNLTNLTHRYYRTVSPP
jgi:hypothetical protein